MAYRLVKFVGDGIAYTCISTELTLFIGWEIGNNYSWTHVFSNSRIEHDIDYANNIDMVEMSNYTVVDTPLSR